MVFDTDRWLILQDGARPHNVTVPISLLKEGFGDNIISRNGQIKVPPRSCDIFPMV